ncbi:MAG: transglutaminase family protein [Bacteroidaceae bacterium]
MYTNGWNTSPVPQATTLRPWRCIPDEGVCQDYAHLLVAACRASGIRARYVNGLTVGEGATHAWVEAYEDGQWIGLDPTAGRCIDYGYIKIAHGRDVGDCPSNRGRISPFTRETLSVSVRVEECQQGK